MKSLGLLLTVVQYFSSSGTILRSAAEAPSTDDTRVVSSTDWMQINKFHCVKKRNSSVDRRCDWIDNECITRIRSYLLASDRARLFGVSFTFSVSSNPWFFLFDLFAGNSSSDTISASAGNSASFGPGNSSSDTSSASSTFGCTGAGNSSSDTFWRSQRQVHMFKKGVLTAFPYDRHSTTTWTITICVCVLTISASKQLSLIVVSWLLPENSQIRIFYIVHTFKIVPQICCRLVMFDE